ncbi:MAG: hypothetical protein JWM59_3392 [Verrucomicrobiales bacterium]|nr:hypothetical protein [Verrucomicrobiales bacterium]
MFLMRPFGAGSGAAAYKAGEKRILEAYNLFSSYRHPFCQTVTAGMCFIR